MVSEIYEFFITHYLYDLDLLFAIENLYTFTLFFHAYFANILMRIFNTLTSLPLLLHFFNFWSAWLAWGFFRFALTGHIWGFNIWMFVSDMGVQCCIGTVGLLAWLYWAWELFIDLLVFPSMNFWLVFNGFFGVLLAHLSY